MSWYQFLINWEQTAIEYEKKTIWKNFMTLYKNAVLEIPYSSYTGTCVSASLYIFDQFSQSYVNAKVSL